MTTDKGIEKELELVAKRLIEINTYLKKIHPRLVILTTLHKDALNSMGLEVENWLKDLEAYVFPERRQANV